MGRNGEKVALLLMFAKVKEKCHARSILFQLSAVLN
jgi:hypothetical protein